MSPSNARKAASCWPLREHLLGSFERLGVKALAEVSVGQVEFHIIGVRTGAQRILKMRDGVVVQAETGEQHADPGLSAIVARAYLVKLRDGLASLVELPQLQIRLSQQVQVLRTVRMLLNLRRQLGEVQLSLLLGSEVGASIEIIEEMLIGIRTR